MEGQQLGQGGFALLDVVASVLVTPPVPVPPVAITPPEDFAPPVSVAPLVVATPLVAVVPPALLPPVAVMAGAEVLPHAPIQMLRPSSVAGRRMGLFIGKSPTFFGMGGGGSITPDRFIDLIKMVALLEPLWHHGWSKSSGCRLC